MVESHPQCGLTIIKEEGNYDDRPGSFHRRVISLQWNEDDRLKEVKNIISKAGSRGEKPPGHVAPPKKEEVRVGIIIWNNFGMLKNKKKCCSFAAVNNGPTVGSNSNITGPAVEHDRWLCPYNPQSNALAKLRYAPEKIVLQSCHIVCSNAYLDLLKYCGSTAR